MISDKLLNLTEPRTHTIQKGYCECCSDYTLTTQQLREYYDLKKLTNVLYTGRLEEVEKVKDLYKMYFDKEIGDEFTTRDWLLMGFQGDRPERDFRGGGVMSLDLIIYFLDKERIIVEDMVKQQNDFFFAVTSINVAFFMKKFFHLADYLDPQLDRHEFCSRRSFKNFCRMICSDRNNYFQFHRLFLKYFYVKIWKTGPKKSLMNFNESYDKFKQKVRIAFNSSDIVQISDIKSQFNSNIK